MKNLISFFINRPVLVKILILSVFTFGIFSILTMQKEGFPKITFKQVMIKTVFPGAAARDVELNVTVPIEEALEEVDGIEELRSTSHESVSTVTAIIDDNADDEEVRTVYDDIEAAVSQIDNLPSDLESQPVISMMTSSDLPVIELAFSAPDREKLFEIIPYIERRLAAIKGVAGIETVGMPDKELHILVDPEKARRYQVGLRSIAAAISSRNIHGSGGTLESYMGEKKVVSVNRFENYRDVLNTYLRVSDLGYSLQLKHLADISLERKEKNLRLYNNGREGVSLFIKKKSSADIIDTIEKVKKVTADINLPEDVSWQPLNDQSELTRLRLKLAGSNALLGLLLVTIILFLVFGFKTAFWTAFGIPFAFMGAFILLNFFDVTLNMFTLAGFIIVIGMLVDDAIVVAENIIFHRESGKNSIEAAVSAVHEIWLPVLGATATTIIAFSPLLALGGMPGQFIFIIPLVVILSLVSALVDSYFVLPAHLTHGNTGEKTDQKKQYIVKLEKIYHRLLEKALKYRYVMLLLFFLLMALTAVIMNRFMYKEAIPQEGTDGFSILYTLNDRGAGFNETRKIIETVEKSISELPSHELDGFSSRAGTHSLAASTDRGSQHNLAVTFVYLSPYENRDRTAEEIMNSLKNTIKNTSYIAEKAELNFDLIRFGPPLGKEIEVRISSNNDRLREKTRHQITTLMKNTEGVSEITDDNIIGKNELNVKINYEKLTLAGLDVEDVTSTLRIAFDGIIVTDMVSVDETVDFRLRLNEKGRANEKFIRNLPIQNRQGLLINLSPFIKIIEKPGDGEIKHINGLRTVTVTANLDENVLTADILMNRIRKNFKSDESVQISFAGQPVETEAIFSDLGIAAVLAFAGIYLIITLVFNSFSQPIVIMAAIPFGAIGVILANFAHGNPVSMFAGVALVGLMGVIVNDSIVMVHTVNSRLRTEDFFTALVTGAVSRLRPILLTTITTVLGVLPTAYGIGGYDPVISQLSLSLAYGLLFGTVIILFLVPILLKILHDLSEKKNKFFSRNKA